MTGKTMPKKAVAKVATKTVQRKAAVPTFEQTLEKYLPGSTFKEYKKTTAASAALLEKLQTESAALRAAASTHESKICGYQDLHAKESAEKSAASDRYRRELATLLTANERALAQQRAQNYAETVAINTKLGELRIFEAKHNEILERERKCNDLQARLNHAEARRADADRWLQILLGSQKVNIPEAARSYQDGG